MMTQTVMTRPLTRKNRPSVTPTSVERDPEREQDRLQARAREMDVLAGGRRVGLERAHRYET